MLFGLTIGLFVAASIYYSGHRAPATTTAPSVREAVRPSASPTAEPVASTGSEAPARETPPHPASRFDFYDMLPQVEVVIPDSQDTSPRREPRTTIDSAGNYVLQAGAFTVLADADRMQASLALLGIESHIQSVPIDDDVYHRVRIGPIDDLAELNRLRRRLWEADVDTLLLRVPN